MTETEGATRKPAKWLIPALIAIVAAIIVLFLLNQGGKGDLDQGGQAQPAGAEASATTTGVDDREARE